MMKTKKVCPVVLRKKAEEIEILAFQHPTAGFQIVKGTIEIGEDTEIAALRELAEESGIISISKCEFKGFSDSIVENQTWYFYNCHVNELLKDNWEFFANEDGGMNFSFFWFNLNEPPTENWHPTFHIVLQYIRENFDL